ncbi:ABC transporter permease [Acidobacterium sp. S8]|uniref:ABC transporter permease n=1 Tax=Acidobacterium sp. S8 TaxID=1641854 RepID=UPI00131E6710|nr:ABC transporter permease [Acidobacterium sp. S8]
MEEGGPEADYSFCTPFFRGLESGQDAFDNVFAFNGDELQVRDSGGNETVHGMLVSGQFFPALETAPLMGRYLTAEDDREGGSPEGHAVVISEHFWESWFHRAPDVVGRKLVIANVPFTVVGVMPKRFIGADPLQRPEIYAPLIADPIIDAPRNHIDAGTHAWWLTVMARLKPGVSLEQANAALLTVSRPILHERAASDPDYIADEDKAHFHFDAESGSSGFTFARFLFRKPLIAMLAMCSGVLLLACLNLASLLMARGAARERELATRLAMGAMRSRLVCQLMVESLLLALLGTAAGLLLAPFVSRSLSALLIGGNSMMQIMAGSAGAQIDTSIDTHVFAFAALIATVSALLIGLVPALQATSGNLSDHIKNGQHATQANERRRTRILSRTLMSFEVALALVLVMSAGLLATSLVRLYKSGVGFEPHGLINIAFSMDKQPLEGDALICLYQQLGDGLSHQPGVKNVSFQFIVPLSHGGWNRSYAAPGKTPQTIFMNSVAPNYFQTMRIPMVTGRDFRWDDTAPAGMKIILNESAAKLLFPGQNALGQQLTQTQQKTTFEVIAVVGDTKYRDMRAPAPPVGYVPIAQDEQPKPSLSAVVRIDGPSAPLTQPPDLWQQGWRRPFRLPS